MYEERKGGGLALARHYVGIGKHREALDALGADGDDLDDVDSWFVRTTALRNLERMPEAVEAARRGLELAPGDIALLDSLALAELARDRFAEAEHALAAALEFEPDDAILHAHLALTLARAGHQLEAHAAIDRALGLAPGSVDVVRIRAQVAYLVHDDVPTVRSYLEDLLRLAPDDQVGHVLLGVLSQREKNFQRSASELAEAARIDPGNRRVVAAAREARAYTHPVFAPVRGVAKFGRWRAYFLFMAISGTLRAVHQPALRIIVSAAWLLVVALSWLGPPVVRRHQKREYGG